MRIFLLFSVLAVILTFAVMGGGRGQKFTQPPVEIFTDMKRQYKYKPQQESPFFADGRADRQPIAGTVATIPDNLAPQVANTVYYSDSVLGTGKDAAGNFAKGFPQPITLAYLQAGREKFDRSCALCHGLTGNGEGITKPFGMSVVANLQEERIRTMAEGEIFNTVTHGKNLMLGYASKFSPEERWQIIAYLRALQKSQNVKVASLPKE